MCFKYGWQVRAKEKVNNRMLFAFFPEPNASAKLCFTVAKTNLQEQWEKK